MFDPWASTLNPGVTHGPVPSTINYKPMGDQRETRGQPMDRTLNPWATHEWPMGQHYYTNGSTHGRLTGDPWAIHGPDL